MTRHKQRQLLQAFMRQVTDHLILQSARWPAEWDGHDLRELALQALEYERTRLMRESPRRRRAVATEIARQDLI